MQERIARTILLVDGSASSLLYLAMLLKRFEYRTLSVRSAEDALRLMETASPAVVVTEIPLPGMSGVELLKQVKDTAAFKAVPVVMLTTERSRERKDACVRLGCSSYLEKPVQPELLYRAIQEASETIPRVHMRLKTSLPVVVGDGTVTGGSRRQEHITALSEGGLYVSTSYPQPKNAVAPIEIALTDRVITARAVVLYTYPPGESPLYEPGMGMKFVELADADRQAIRDFIRRELARSVDQQGTEADS
jgi:CheY-like chemotaxis protein